MTYTYLTEHLPKWVHDYDNNEWTCEVTDCVLVVQYNHLTDQYVWALDAKIGFGHFAHDRELHAGYAESVYDAEWKALQAYRRFLVELDTSEAAAAMAWSTAPDSDPTYKWWIHGR